MSRKEIGEIVCRKCGSFNIELLDTKRTGSKLSTSYRCKSCGNFWVSKLKVGKNEEIYI